MRCIWGPGGRNRSPIFSPSCSLPFPFLKGNFTKFLLLLPFWPHSRLQQGEAPAGRGPSSSSIPAISGCRSPNYLGRRRGKQRKDGAPGLSLHSWWACEGVCPWVSPRGSGRSRLCQALVTGCHSYDTVWDNPPDLGCRQGKAHLLGYESQL